MSGGVTRRRGRCVERALNDPPNKPAVRAAILVEQPEFGWPDPTPLDVLAQLKPWPREIAIYLYAKVELASPPHPAVIGSLPVRDHEQIIYTQQRPPSLFLNLSGERFEQGLANLYVAPDDVPAAWEQTSVQRAAVHKYSLLHVADQGANDTLAALTLRGSLQLLIVGHSGHFGPVALDTLS